MKLYRGISSDSYTSDVIYPMDTKRVPSNIPYVVDNILEWLRPEDKPCRRFATYASPKRELAEKYANDNTLICTIEFQGDYQAVQLTDYADAKLHPDIKRIQKMVMGTLGQDWIDSDVMTKSLNFGALFLPSICHNSIHNMMIKTEMNELREQLLEEVTFWKDCKHVDDTELTDGEVFFYAEDGYKLIKN